jgi:cytochrome P450
MPRNISGGRLMAIEMDPPEQAPWRKLYTDAVTPAALEKFEPKLAALANSVIDAFAAKGECDLVRDFAEPLPVLAVCDLIGLTGKDPTIIRDLAYEFTTNISDSVHRQDSDARMAQFIVGELMARRAAPRDDYLTRIALAEIDGRRMNESELMLFMTGFLVAGHETTTSALTSLLFCSLSQPELGARMLEDQKALAAGIEEALRLHAPFHGFTRTTTVPVEIAGVIVGADEPIRLCYAAANRDPTKFDHPDKFDIDRPKRMHFAFGGGRHACAGAPLARMEMRVAFRELLRRLPGIALVEKLLERDFVGGLLAAPRSLTATFPR